MLSQHAWSIQSPESVQDSHKNADRVHNLEFRASMTEPIVCKCGWKLELEPQRRDTCLIKKVASVTAVP